MSEQPEQRRQTPTERNHEALMAALTKAPAAPESSVSLTRNAKGDRQWDIVVRGLDAEACEQLATAIDARLDALYPHSSKTAPEAPAGK